MGSRKGRYMKKISKQIFLIPPAAFIYSIGISLFLDPNGIAPGGVTGVAIALSRILPIDTGTFIFVLNIPLLIMAWRLFGMGFVLSSLYTLANVSLFTNILENFTPPTTDLLLSAAGGGALMALGLGLILRNGTTTGGTDIIVKLIRRRKKHLKTGFLFMIVDICVLVFSYFILRDFEKLMYAGITVLIISVVLDMVLYGQDEAKLIFIISENADLLTTCFLNRLEIGVTQLDGIGGYTRKNKKIIMCVMKKRLAPFVIDTVKELDPKAFMIVTKAGEIYGKGYKSYQEGKII